MSSRETELELGARRPIGLKSRLAPSVDTLIWRRSDLASARISADSCETLTVVEQAYWTSGIGMRLARNSISRDDPKTRSSR